MINTTREAIQLDVVIMGAKPAGLSATIVIKQRAIAAGQEISAVVVKKSSEVGAHILWGSAASAGARRRLRTAASLRRRPGRNLGFMRASDGITTAAD
ncbi:MULTISPECIES: hypothetical protein [Rhizobium]|uniref:Electron transfer flavoprotein-ubiquinone oxidoreductase n=1 Tax=Rhizobium favelukesii TaxID=348824 RepID=W6RNG2_9HYPH|nr:MULTISPECIES: hypothetical protein [Rhizobium]MCA0801327.1 hypothetical protein [Rhizobium sp. T1473]MCS0457795.1 hypothetical protein [Rhizobium favelukesii]CDM62279.1 hypothetical protein LPU83_pLPU83d_0909 [Rhizobium favelukesii]